MIYSTKQNSKKRLKGKRSSKRRKKKKHTQFDPLNFDSKQENLRPYFALHTGLTNTQKRLTI